MEYNLIYELLDFKGHTTYPRVWLCSMEQKARDTEFHFYTVLLNLKIGDNLEYFE